MLAVPLESKLLLMMFVNKCREKAFTLISVPVKLEPGNTASGRYILGGTGKELAYMIVGVGYASLKSVGQAVRKGGLEHTGMD